ncbi:cytochrome-c oxidase, cbb3-type subunit III [Kordiimonas aquimaris]|uniref:cytochrome-c oxidase, cbb3-type subunit III n=1 Tax=Kordiimonas aquimaris TaxID=707591 RepID=UPI0021CE3673|nr:cytochrome-c oxidase, cbb3-type subunit III [Kordiimonas aquimaris]
MKTENRQVDEITGTETTGHEWDGITELDTPMPRWWLIVFYVTIIWSIGYWFYYPTWPTFSGEGERGGTVGSAEWTQYKQLEDQQAEIMAVRAQYQQQFESASFSDVQSDETLYAYAIAGGKSAFGDNCATCHGTGGAGAPGYPNLNDDDWLWGGSVDDIYQTLRYGIRSNHPETRFAEMPAFGEMLSTDEVSSIAAYLVEEDASNVSVGATLYEENCAVCHGDTGMGGQDFGAPNLRDAIWFYGGSKAEIELQIKKPKHGVMPAWEDRLSESTLRQLTIYVHSLGGGQ